MRGSALMNGGLIGFGLGFIGASLALYQLVATYIPKYTSTWHIRGIAIVGGVGLVIGIGLEVYERMRIKRESGEEEYEDEEYEDEDEEEEEEEEE
ncbi:hypothetical protein ACFLW0_00635 [Chloroflexota bacterium]